MSNLLKAGLVKGGEEKRVIDYNELIQEKLKAIRISLQENGGGNGEFIAGLNAEVVEELVNPEEELEKTREEASQLLEYAKEQVEQARIEAEQILNQARIEGAQLKQQAYEEGKATGNADGYQDGIRNAKQEIDGIKAGLVQERAELEREYEENLRKMEPRLVDTILEVFEKVTYVLAEEKREMMLHLVDRALARIESSRQFLVRVSKEDYPFVAEHKEMLADKVPTSSEIDIVKDATLVRNQCLIETDGGVFDCSLDVQLENLVRDIRILASF